jgi:ketosteroid isomerase-like protein
LKSGSGSNCVILRRILSSATALCFLLPTSYFLISTSPVNRILLSSLVLLAVACSLPAQNSAPDSADLTKLLQDFLAGAGKNDIAMHDRFWADELVYTSALGRRKGKADIMRELRAEPATPKPEEGTTVYTAEEIRIQQYGDTAIVAFRLVATTDKAGPKEVKNFLNTGTFLKRRGKWQVVAWQATALPQAPEKAP